MAKCHPVCAAQYSSTFMYTARHVLHIHTLVEYTGIHCTVHTWCMQGCALSQRGWTLVPNFCSCVTRKSQIFDTNRMLGTLDFTGSEH